MSLEVRTAEREGRVPAWLLGAFFASGAAGLVYEVVWSKVLSTTLGNSLFAIATVVSAFFGGLALGACTLGIRLARRLRRIERYALLEVAVGILGALSVPALRALDPLFVTLHRAVGPSFALFLAIRFSVVFLVLLVPTALMGATLPVLVAHAEGRRFGGALSRLYAANTLGAVAGTVAAAFALIPALGLTGSAAAAAVANLVAAGAAWAKRGERPTLAETAPTTAPAAPALPPGAASLGPAAVVLLVALSGFAALVFEVAWTRVLTLTIGSSVLSFAVVLAFYLLGIALGSAAVARRLARAERPLLWFAGLQIALALVVLSHLSILPALPGALLAIIIAPQTTVATYLGAQALFVGALLVPPCLLLGAIFPTAARLLHTSDAGRTTGVAYGVNTLGTILGSLATGFFLIPRIGSRATLLAGAFLSLAIGLVALARAGTTGPRRAGATAGALLAAAALVLGAPRWDPRVLTAGVYRPAAARFLADVVDPAGRGRVSLAQAAAAESLLFFREGINATVSLHVPRGTEDLVLKIGGKADASRQDIETQLLSGYLPMLFARDGARAAVIGHGSGMTLEGILRAGAASAEAIEIEKAVLEASRWFHPPGEDPLDDPRARVVLEDGRTHLAVARTRYDVIVSEPSNPWLAGNNSLFTRDFYRLVRSRLAPHGVFTQWIQLYELSPATLASLLSAYRSVFPDTFAFVTYRADLILVAAGPGAVARLERLHDPEVATDLARIGLDPPELIVSYYACSLSELPPELVEGVPNTDDNARVEYRAPIDLFRVGRREALGGGEPGVAERIPRSLHVPFVPGAEPGSLARWRALGLARQGRFEAARAAAAWLAGSGDAAAADSLARAIASAEEEARVKEIGIEVARLGAAGEAAEAERRLRDGLARTPDDPALLFHLGIVLMQTSRGEDADSLFARVVDGGHPVLAPRASNNRGILAMRRGETEAGIAHFRRAQALLPSLAESYVYESRAEANAGRPEEARAAVARGLAACPRDPGLLARQAQVGGL